MEPTEGNYQLGWLDRVIAIAQRNGFTNVPQPIPAPARAKLLSGKRVLAPCETAIRQ